MPNIHGMDVKHIKQTTGGYQTQNIKAAMVGSFGPEPQKVSTLARTRLRLWCA